MRTTWLPAMLTVWILGTFSLAGCSSETSAPGPVAQNDSTVPPSTPPSGPTTPPGGSPPGGSGDAAPTTPGGPSGLPEDQTGMMPGGPDDGSGAMPPSGGPGMGPSGGPGASMPPSGGPGMMPGDGSGAMGPPGGAPGGGAPGGMLPPLNSPDMSPTSMPGGMPGGMPGDMPGDMPGGMPGDSGGDPYGYGSGPGMMPGYDTHPGGTPGGMSYPPGYGSDYPGAPGYGMGPGMGPAGRQQQPAEPPRELTYAEKSHQAFQEGNHQQAFRYLFADFLTNDKEARSNYGKMRWVPALQRPAVAVRWGIAVDYSSGNYDGDPKPIGTTQTPSIQGRGRGGGGGGGSGPGAGGYSDPSAGMSAGMPGGYGGMGGASRTGSNASRELVEKYTGDLGKEILERFEKRIKEGREFGEVLADALKPASPTPGSGRPGPGMPGMTGPGGVSMPGGYDSTMSGVDYGYGAPGMEGMTGGANRGGERDAGEDEPQQILPGLVMLGVGRREALLDRAREQELDVVVMFQVDVSENRRNGIINNTTRTVLYDVAKREPVKDTPARALNNMRVQNDREKRSDRDPVPEVAEQLFTFIDQHLAMRDMPKGINAENTLRRVGQLLQSEAPVWERLNEVRFYRSRNLMSQSDLEKAFERMLGEKLGPQLAKGNADKKKEAIASLIGD